MLLGRLARGNPEPEDRIRQAGWLLPEGRRRKAGKPASSSREGGTGRAEPEGRGRKGGAGRAGPDSRSPKAGAGRTAPGCRSRGSEDSPQEGGGLEKSARGSPVPEVQGRMAGDGSQGAPPRSSRRAVARRLGPVGRDWVAGAGRT